MNRIAKFEKVSFNQFFKDLDQNYTRESAEAAYSEIKLPVRATAGSAGYDLPTPFDVKLAPGETVKIFTGLRCRISEGWVLFVMPKSGLGFKYRIQLDNTVGVVDQDYYGSDNEGHIIVQITNDGRQGKTVEIPAGKAFAQALFLPFGITEDDEAVAVRNGGFGSTGK